MPSQMRLIERLALDIDGFQIEADRHVRDLVGTMTAGAYRSFLETTLGFVWPLELALATTRGIHHMIDMRRFAKHLLLQHDLQAFHVKREQIAQLPRCSIPALETVEQALGWVYPIERSTLSHAQLFRQLASVIPGEVAFTSAYLKAHFGTMGENWNGYATALERVAITPAAFQRLVQAARASLETYSAWFATRGASDEQQRYA